jgi:hypothetical protein
VTHDAGLAARCERRIHIADGQVTEIDHALLPLPLREGAGGGVGASNAPRPPTARTSPPNLGPLRGPSPQGAGE